METKFGNERNLSWLQKLQTHTKNGVGGVSQPFLRICTIVSGRKFDSFFCVHRHNIPVTA